MVWTSFCAASFDSVGQLVSWGIDVVNQTSAAISQAGQVTCSRANTSLIASFALSLSSCVEPLLVGTGGDGLDVPGGLGGHCLDMIAVYQRRASRGCCGKISEARRVGVDVQKVSEGEGNTSLQVGASI